MSISYYDDINGLGNLTFWLTTKISFLQVSGRTQTESASQDALFAIKLPFFIVAKPPKHLCCIKGANFWKTFLKFYAVKKRSIVRRVFSKASDCIILSIHWAFSSSTYRIPGYRLVWDIAHSSTVVRDAKIDFSPIFRSEQLQNKVRLSSEIRNEERTGIQTELVRIGATGMVWLVMTRVASRSSTFRPNTPAVIDNSLKYNCNIAICFFFYFKHFLPFFVSRVPLTLCRCRIR